MIVRYYKSNINAQKPTKKVDTDACWDLYTVQDSGDIKPGEVKLIDTGIAFIIPDGFEGVVRQRSGLSLKWPSYIANAPGTIDQDYRDTVKIEFFNATDAVISIPRGTKIAQIGFREVPPTDLTEISEQEFHQIKSRSDRKGGFGSSDIRDYVS